VSWISAERIFTAVFIFKFSLLRLSFCRCHYFAQHCCKNAPLHWTVHENFHVDIGQSELFTEYVKCQNVNWSVCLWLWALRCTCGSWCWYLCVRCEALLTVAFATYCMGRVGGFTGFLTTLCQCHSKAHLLITTICAVHVFEWRQTDSYKYHIRHLHSMRCIDSRLTYLLVVG